VKPIDLCGDASNRHPVAVGYPALPFEVREDRLLRRQGLLALEQQRRDPGRIVGMDRPRHAHEVVQRAAVVGRAQVQLAGRRIDHRDLSVGAARIAAEAAC